MQRGTDTLLRSYAWGPSLGGGVGGLLSITDHVASKTYLPFYDGNGNVVGMTDAADGSLASVYEYTPFGELVAAEGPAANVNAFRLSTKYYDAEMWAASGLAPRPTIDYAALFRHPRVHQG